MESFLIRLLIVIGVLWLIQTILSALSIEAQAAKIIFLITLIVGILWLLFGQTWFGLR